MQERVARQYLADERTMAKNLVALDDAPRYGTKRISPDEELDFWDFEDTALDVDALRIEGLNERTLKMLEDVGVDTKRIDMDAYRRLQQQGRPDESWIKALRWPHQVRLMTSGGRALSQDAQIKYTNHMQKRSAERAAERAAAEAETGAMP